MLFELCTRWAGADLFRWLSLYFAGSGFCADFVFRFFDTLTSKGTQSRQKCGKCTFWLSLVRVRTDLVTRFVVIFCNCIVVICERVIRILDIIKRIIIFKNTLWSPDAFSKSFFRRSSFCARFRSYQNIRMKLLWDELPESLRKVYSYIHQLRVEYRRLRAEWHYNQVIDCLFSSWIWQHRNASSSSLQRVASLGWRRVAMES